jgi:hypothetical protein
MLLRNRLRGREGEEKRERERGLGFGIINSILPQSGLLPKSLTNPKEFKAKVKTQTQTQGEEKLIGDERLIQAEKLIREYANEVGCSWCSRKAEETATLIKYLREVTPLASQMAERVGPLEQSKMAELKAELEKAREEIKRRYG